MALNIKKAYTFDDLLLVPKYSELNLSDIDLSTKLTKNITLNIPFLSAAMDTVTESKMAIAVARQGGMGVIHKNLSIEQQVNEVEKVKRNESGFIHDPITLNIGQTINEANEIMAHYKISGLPVVDENNKLIGIFTNRDMKVASSYDEIVDKYMTTKNLITINNNNIDLEKAKEILINNRIEKLPIIDENHKLKGLITIKDINNKIDFPNACKDNKGRLRVGAALGFTNDWEQRLQALVKANVDAVFVDSAHGHSKNIISLVKNIKEKYPNLDVIAGNVVSKEAAVDLINAGVDCIKVGIGPGSICTTRVVSGVGVPQITAINEVYEVAKIKEIPVIGDGGIKYSGDIVKALAAGANCVMLGSIFAATLESPGEEIKIDNKIYKSYVGMGSIAAMKRGSADRYFQKKGQKLVAEGVEARVLLKDNVANILYQLLGGIRSGLGYCGALNIEALQRTATFVEISNSGLKESHPHDVEIAKQAPNYS